MSCDEAIINVDWQFNVNAHEGASSFTDTPLRALASFGYYRELNINTHRVELLRPDADTLAINALLRGQSHNSAAQQTYINCAAQLGIYAFFRLIVSAAPGRPSDFAELRINISWEARNAPSEIRSARNNALSAQNVRDADARSLFMIRTMSDLMFGQRHNAAAMQLYRACFRDDPDQFLAIITEPNLIPPEDMLRRILEANRLADETQK